MTGPMGSQPFTAEREAEIRDAPALRHLYRMRPCPRREGIIEHYHDEDDCDLCAVWREVDRLRAREARAIERIEGEAHRLKYMSHPYGEGLRDGCLGALAVLRDGETA